MPRVRRPTGVGGWVGASVNASTKKVPSHPARQKNTILHDWQRSHAIMRTRGPRSPTLAYCTVPGYQPSGGNGRRQEAHNNARPCPHRVGVHRHGRHPDHRHGPRHAPPRPHPQPWHCHPPCVAARLLTRAPPVSDRVLADDRRVGVDRARRAGHRRRHPVGPPPCPALVADAAETCCWLAQGAALVGVVQLGAARRRRQDRNRR
eukprot:COSAG04_NODE_3243_length_3012_cov_4.642293_2_plen_205_part_00